MASILCYSLNLENPHLWKRLHRWYCLEASEAIIAWGRDFLKKTMEDAEKHGFKVLYADTDGFYATYTQSENEEWINKNIWITNLNLLKNPD